MKRLISIALLCLFCAGVNAAGSSTRRVFFVEPTDGSTVTSPVKVGFGLEGMELRPAGDLTEGTGHHHLLIDSDPISAGQVVPADANHLHFGKAQTATEVTLSPGVHRLTLQFANGAHISYGPEMAKTITVTVRQ